MSDPKNNLSDLIESSRQEAQAQQAKLDALRDQSAPAPRAKQILTTLLLAAAAVSLFYQAPRFTEPLVWPDPATNPAAAEGDLAEVVGFIEAYRLSQGKYPATLSQVNFSSGLAALISESVLRYQPTEQGYALDWTQANWHATFDSVTQKVVVEPAGKK